MKNRKRNRALFAWLLIVVMMLTPLGAWAADEPAGTSVQPAASTKFQASHASEMAAQIGVLVGDGQGVNDAYLAKTTTRLQAAIVLLKLLGKHEEAVAYKGAGIFSDASSVAASMRPVLAYLKNHPELGWKGTGGGKFSPNAPVTAQQLYKVMLESLSYVAGTDFDYADTLRFAASKGLSRAAEAAPFTNRSLALALLETLQAAPKNGTKPLGDVLADKRLLSAEHAALLKGLRIDLRKAADGSTYFTDGKGMALYLFTKDMLELDSCVGGCLQAWPVFGADQLLLADELDSKDFGAFVRKDGLKQITYKGWPLYYYQKDQKPGDVTGEGVGKVWYLIKQPFYTVTLGTHAELGNYLVDSKGLALYYFDKDPKGATVCFGDCLKNWPVFYTEKPVVPSGLKAEDFGEIVRPDGGKQTTYKGYPLYYWIKDTKRGDTTGQNVGKVWFVVNPEKFDGNAAEKAGVTRETVEMKNYAFSKTDITVKAGTVITFVNRDKDRHNVHFADESVRTPLLGEGESVTLKLDKPGVYEFYCDPHKDHMKGKITVQ
ncbi:plastocyanin/azurin family copper-binding protein [Cohnella pontilimi]|nr:plastocyanin/azurin family copper-binding protein [Cohnella pontilimi]